MPDLKSKSPLRLGLNRLKKNRSAMLSLGFIVLITLSAIFARWLAPYGYEFQDLKAMLNNPSWNHWLGTDELGRDLLSRIIYGARISLAVAYFSTFFSLILGVAYGSVSGYVGGRLDNFLMRIADVVYSFPDLLLIILINASIDREGLALFFERVGMPGLVKLVSPEIISLLFALSLVSWVNIARLIRGEVLRIREEKFVESAVALGAKPSSILFKHILPNTFGPLIVTLTFRIPSVILAESTLSFIGLGIQPPLASWGTLANTGFAHLRFHPHLILFPSLAIFLTILAFNFLGDGLRDAFSPGENK
jgi:ABC-type dipeptide/oligopeptide/nickel transport system permease subunit